MFPGWLQIALVVLLIVLLFGRGKISGLMGDVAQGITSFRKGLKEGMESPEEGETPKAVEDRKTIDGEVVKSSETQKDKTDA
ncbi:Sec-independent protein translocase family protein [Kordiimonas aestuarii]|uniref:twin-arginine translocase TatA/TatE family subunit n=1 Tax=Kordiimonas aestuarii TaxID=1005925 RepID=UPI0021CEDAC4|nr:twin-arginine translocase TatA/TatE family subunit [Kordiimonas aestuarii]